MCSAEHSGRVAQEEFEQRVFSSGQLELPDSAPGSAFGRVQLEVGVAQNGLRGTRASHQRAQPRTHLVKCKWLGQVVVRSGIQADDPVGHQITGSQHEDGYVVARARI